MEIKPSELRIIKIFNTTTKELNKFNLPYSLGGKNFARTSNIKKLIPLFKKEKKEKIIPFLMVILLLQYCFIVLFFVCSTEIFIIFFKIMQNIHFEL